MSKEPSKIGLSALPAEQKSTLKLVRVCDHAFCLKTMTPRNYNGVFHLPCYELEIDAQKEMLERALAAYYESRLLTVEKNPGPHARIKKPLQDPAQPETPKEQAQKVVTCLVEFLTLFGFSETGYSTAGDVAAWAAWIENVGDWMKVAKWKLAAFYAYAQRDLLEDTALPPAPGNCGRPLHLLGGRAGRFAKRQIRKSNPNRQEFLSSLLLVKTGMPRPDSKALEQAALKTIAALTTSRITRGPREVARASVTGSELHRLVSLNSIEEEVRRTVRESFRTDASGAPCKLRFTNHDLLSNAITPSSSANYIRSKTNKGVLGELIDRNFFGQRIRPTLTAERIHSEEHIAQGSPTFQVRGFNGMRDQFVHTYFSAARAAMRELPLAEAVPLAEALKVRVITKGPAFTQYCLVPVQKFMWKQLASLPTFELTGTPITQASLRKRLGDLHGEEAWLSGDYSDATNQMDPRLSNAAWDEFCSVCCLPESLRQLGYRVLTGHLIVSDRKAKSRRMKAESALPQKWGQLMGSIISFPILCLVNAAVCRMAIEHDTGRRVSLRDAPLMVNGDDCLLKVGPAGYAAWGAYGTMAGLSPSVGKVYYSKSFCNMNSTTFTYRWSGEPDTQTFERVKVIRLGLVFGMKRSEGPSDQGALVKQIEALFGTGASHEWDASIASRHRAVVEECPPLCLERVHKKFLSKNATELEFATKNFLPWYIPACFGGLGLTPLPQFGFDASEKDKKIVAAMVHTDYWLRGGEHLAPQPVKIGNLQEMRIHQVGLHELKRLLGSEYREKWIPEGAGLGVAESRKLDSWAIYQRWEEILDPRFAEWERQTDEELEAGDRPDFKQMKRQVAHNRKVWQWYVHHMELFGAIRPGTITPMRRVPDVNVTEERVSTLPTASDVAFSEIDEILYGHTREDEDDSAKGARALSRMQLRIYELEFHTAWDPYAAFLRPSNAGFI